MERKVRIFIVATLCLMGCVALWTKQQPANVLFQNEIEALTREIGDGTIGDGTVILRCYCALLSDHSCAVNNNGSSVCASGVNVTCWSYNNNCN